MRYVQPRRRRLLIAKYTRLVGVSRQRVSKVVAKRHDV